MEWRADAHQRDQVPSADEESRNTLKVTGGRGEKHDHNWTKGNDELGSTVEHQPVGKLVQPSLGEAIQAGFSKLTQFSKPIDDRTGKPVTQEIVGKSQGELRSDRTGELVKDEEKRVMKDHDHGETCGSKLAQSARILFSRTS